MNLNFKPLPYETRMRPVVGPESFDSAGVEPWHPPATFQRCYSGLQIASSIRSFPLTSGHPSSHASNTPGCPDLSDAIWMYSNRNGMPKNSRPALPHVGSYAAVGFAGSVTAAAIGTGGLVTNDPEIAFEVHIKHV